MTSQERIALPEGDATNTGKPELVFDPDTNTYGIIVDRVEVIHGLDPVGLRNGTVKATVRSVGKQSLWDDIVRTGLAHGQDGTIAAHNADLVIAQRRKHGAP